MWKKVEYRLIFRGSLDLKNKRGEIEKLLEMNLQLENGNICSKRLIIDLILTLDTYLFVLTTLIYAIFALLFSTKLNFSDKKEV